MVTDSSGGKAYQLQNAIKKPNQEKNQTRPYILIGLRPGIDRALWLIGLTSGALKSSIGLYILAVLCEVTGLNLRCRGVVWDCSRPSGMPNEESFCKTDLKDATI